MTAYNSALDQADPLTGCLKLGDGQRWRGQTIDGKEVRGASAHGAHTFWVNLMRYESGYGLHQVAVDRQQTKSRWCRACWPAAT